MSLLEIKKQITGVRNTKKITKAMQLVAASKMRAFQKKALSSRQYVWSLLDILGGMQHTTSSYGEVRKEGKTVFVLYTSDKGLCGGLNNQLEKSLIRSNKWLQTPESDRLLITIGRKATEFANVNGISIYKSFIGISEKLTTLDALTIIDELLELWNNKTSREILFAVPHYKNSFTFYPRLKAFLPFSSEMITSYTKEHEHEEVNKENSEAGSYMIYEPSIERVEETLYEMVIRSAFLQSFFELKASEYSSRMIAMQSATDAAEKRVSSLTLVYNKTRQQVITQQLAEIVGAGEAVAN